MKVNGVEYGGGGGGISFVEVEIINTTEDEQELGIVNLINDTPIGSMFIGSAIIPANDSLQINTIPSEYNKVMALGNTFEVTGELSYNSAEHFIAINGSGTITIS